MALLTEPRFMVLGLAILLSSSSVAMQIDSAAMSQVMEPINVAELRVNVVEFREHTAKWLAECTNPRGCDTTAKLMGRWADYIESIQHMDDQADKMASVQHLYKFGSSLGRHYAPKFASPETSYSELWGSFDKSANGELTPSRSGAANTFFESNGFEGADMDWVFGIADLDGSGGISKDELTDLIHLSIEVPGASMNKDPLACWAGVFHGVTKVKIPKYCA